MRCGLVADFSPVRMTDYVLFPTTAPFVGYLLRAFRCGYCLRYGAVPAFFHHLFTFLYGQAYLWLPS